MREPNRDPGRDESQPIDDAAAELRKLRRMIARIVLVVVFVGLIWAHQRSADDAKADVREQFCEAGLRTYDNCD